MVADSIDDSVVLSKIGFGSCSNQRKGPLRPVFERLQNESFQLWIWTGDVVYTKGSDLPALELAYDQLKKEGSYDKFATSVGRVIGTWDDHDLGVNDGGKETPDIKRRQELYLDLLKVPKDSSLRTRNGVFSSHDYGPKDKRVRVILMDTRSGRGEYAFSYVGALGSGTILGKISPLMAAVCRSFVALTGLNKRLSDWGWSNYEMLDNEQWKWLEHQLKSSSADVNILVSSVQVLTRVPSVESWGHFPAERDRLLRLINEAGPRGFVMLSGDVHIGIAAFVNDFDPNSPMVELTSSGLTHTCTAGGIPYFLCSLVWNIFESNRRRESMILSRNFGSINIDWDKKQFVVSLTSLTDNVTSEFTRSFEPVPLLDIPHVPGVTPPRILADVVLVGSILAIMTLLSLIITLIYWKCRRK